MTINEVADAYLRLLTARIEFHARTLGFRVESELADAQDAERYKAVKAASRTRARALTDVARTKRALNRASRHPKAAGNLRQLTADHRRAQEAAEDARAQWEAARASSKDSGSLAAFGRLARASFWPALAVVAAFAVAALSWKPAQDPAAATADETHSHLMRRGAVGFAAIIVLGISACLFAAVVIEGTVAGVLIPFIIAIHGMGLRAWIHACDRHESALADGHAP